MKCRFGSRINSWNGVLSRVWRQEERGGTRRDHVSGGREQTWDSPGRSSRRPAVGSETFVGTTGFVGLPRKFCVVSLVQ